MRPAMVYTESVPSARLATSASVPSGLIDTPAARAVVGLAPGVYWARTQVLLLGPPSESRRTSWIATLMV